MAGLVPYTYPRLVKLPRWSPFPASKPGMKGHSLFLPVLVQPQEASLAPPTPTPEMQLGEQGRQPHSSSSEDSELQAGNRGPFAHVIA